MVTIAMFGYILAILGVIGAWWAFGGNSDNNRLFRTNRAKHRKSGYKGQHRAIRTFGTLLDY